MMSTEDKNTLKATLPLNTYLVSFFLENNISFSSDTLLVAVQHHLEDTLDLFLACVDLGIPNKNIFSLGKVYSNVPQVVEKMKNLGIQVSVPNMPKVGDFYTTFDADVSSLWQKALFFAETNNVKNILILDDGGLLFKYMPEGVSAKYNIAGVEQTTSGLYVFEKYGFPCPIVMQASSAAKKIYESPMFTQAAKHKSLSVLKDYDEKIDTFGVIGLGSIGVSLAKQLAESGKKVYVFDNNDRKAVDLKKLSNIIICTTPEKLFKHSLMVFGCTGRDIFAEQSGGVLPHKSGLVLASVSSGDIEFKSLFSNYVCSLNDDVKTVHLQTQYGKVSILNNGWPINFDNVTGSAPPKLTQLTTSLLLCGLMQASEMLGSQYKNLLYKLSPSIQNSLLSLWFSEVPEAHQYFNQATVRKCTTNFLDRYSDGIQEYPVSFSSLHWMTDIIV